MMQGKKSKKMLGKMKMPGDKMHDLEDMSMEDLSAMDEGEAAEPKNEEMGESTAEESDEMNNPENSPELPNMSDLSDDDLIAEIRKRGLMDKLMKGKKSDMESEPAMDEGEYI